MYGAGHDAASEPGVDDEVGTSAGGGRWCRLRSYRPYGQSADEALSAEAGLLADAADAALWADAALFADAAEAALFADAADAALFAEAADFAA